MANKDVREFGQKTIRQADMIADYYYQRDGRAEELLPKVLKQLILYTQLLEQAGESITDFAEQMRNWGAILGKLTNAAGSEDGILTADILHHEVIPALNRWVETS